MCYAKQFGILIFSFIILLCLPAVGSADDDEIFGGVLGMEWQLLFRQLGMRELGMLR